MRHHLDLEVRCSVTDLEILARLLGDLVKAYERVLEILGEQTRALVSHNLTALETLPATMSSHLLHAADIEAERYLAQQRLARSLGEPASEMTLERVVRLAEQTDTKIAVCINESGEALRHVLKRIGDAQHLNATMITRQLRLQRRVFSTFQKGSAYNPDGSLPVPKTEIINKTI